MPDITYLRTWEGWLYLAVIRLSLSVACLLRQVEGEGFEPGEASARAEMGPRKLAPV